MFSTEAAGIYFKVVLAASIKLPRQSRRPAISQLLLRDCVIFVRDEVPEENKPLQAVQRAFVYHFRVIKELEYLFVFGREAQVPFRNHKLSQLYGRIYRLEAFHRQCVKGKLIRELLGKDAFCYLPVPSILDIW